MKESENLQVCGGCNAKLPPGMLSEILKNLETNYREDVLVGFDTKDDAGVIKISEDKAMVFTLDFFPPMVEDPYKFGQIAACNAMSDVYAMNAEVMACLNILGYPEDGDVKTLEKLLEGGAQKIMEAGGSLIGGHSIHDSDPKYGLSVVGMVDLDKMWTNNEPEIGHELILTKALGVTLVTNGFNLGINTKEEFDKVVESMTKLNKEARDIFKDLDVSAATDVTGFGFLGHLSEMIDKKATAIIDSKALPVFDGARKAANEFVLTKGSFRNSKYVDDLVEYQVDDFALREVLNDPQTSGGLLLAVSPDESKQAIDQLKQTGHQAAIIGKIHKRFDKDIIII